ncbi:M23 family metallopeptidase [Lolliginicoccus levis]|uniref:M23 family metallopeptidase n=1 Tax=Lolliginicoccus levis TaxID=2919542 RepID=UPI0035A23A1D
MRSRRQSRPHRALIAAGAIVIGTMAPFVAAGGATAQSLPFDTGSAGSGQGISLPWAAHPAVGVLTSGYGPRWGRFHEGVDIAAPIGAPVFAAGPGVVTDVGPATGFGQWVRIRHLDGTSTVYGHIDRYFVAPGQPVVSGQQIATVGNRGDSTGPHLHFEVRDPLGRSMDPQGWLISRALPTY